jgi:hypothetical protein
MEAVVILSMRLKAYDDMKVRAGAVWRSRPVAVLMLRLSVRWLTLCV